MLKNTNVEIIHSIERYIVDAKHKRIDVEIATGSVIDGLFKSDGRDLITYNITNIPDSQKEQIDTLIVNAQGHVLLSKMPIDNNDIIINGTSTVHVGGQEIACDSYVEGDTVTISYYYDQVGHNWFDEAAMFIRDEHSEYIGLTDYQYNSKRIWSILVEMGLIDGVIV